MEPQKTMTVKLNLEGEGYRQYDLLMALETGDVLLQDVEGDLYWTRITDRKLLDQFRQAVRVQRWFNLP